MLNSGCNVKKAVTMIFSCFLTIASISLFSVKHAYAAPNFNSIFHDQGDVYISPLEPTAADVVTLRLRTAAEPGLTVVIKYYDTVNSSWNYVNMAYEYTDSTGVYYFWKGTIPASSSIKRYRFSVMKDNVTYWYDAKGYSTSEPSTLTLSYDYWIEPGFKTPDWAKGTTWYSIMPDSFWNGDLRNDTRLGRTKVFPGEPLLDMGWGNKHLGGSDWYGGDLKGITSKTSTYLKNTLGINSLYFNPIWDTGHNAGYGQDDYSTVNPVLGTNEDLKTLINTAHTNNIKVMLDGVFQYHLDSGKWFNKYNYYPILGAYQSQNSVYYPRFYFTAWPNSYQTSWGSPVLDYDSIDVRKDIYQDANSVMQMYLKAPYSADGWRLDVGNTLWGHTLNAHTILKDMRGYVKSANSNALFLSEHISGDNDLNDYTLDSRWNYPFNDALRAWAKQTKNQSGLNTDLLDTTLKYPRSVALTLYNFLSSHDYTRFFNETGSDVGTMNLAQILQMTLIGAPSVYFGDEYGEKSYDPAGQTAAAPNSFNSFNWNSSDWNYRIFNMYKSLIALRNQYSALRTGVFKNLIADDTNKIYSFARWDENGKIIVITNQNTSTVNVTVSPREMSVTDGAVMTDWLTGRTFTVSGGNIIVPVWAKSGAVLVAGNSSSSYRGEYEAKDIGSVVAAGKSVTTSSSSYEVSGSGNMTGTADTFHYLYSSGYDDFNTYTRVDYIDPNNSSAMAASMIRQNTGADSKYYSVYVTQAGQMGISYRTTTGGTATTTSLGTVTSWPVWILAQRSGNTFKAYYVTDFNGAPGTWNLIASSLVNIQMDNEVLQGIASASTDSIARKVVFTSPSYTKFNAAKFDTFDNTVPGSLFTIVNTDTSIYSISNSMLNLTTNNTGKNFVVADAPFGKDWTAKTKISFSPTVNGQEADLLAMQDTNNYLKVCRIRDNGTTKLGFGTVIGSYTEYNTLINDPVPGSDIYLQLQRIGSRYSAMYSTDGSNWNELGTSELLNFSKTQVGMTAKAADTSAATAGFDYFSFGNAINGEDIYSSGELQIPCNTSFSNISTVTNSGNWVAGLGIWSYTEGGFGQSSTTESSATMNLANKPYDDFYLETSIKLNSTGGWGGISFRHPNYSDTYNNSGYLLYMTSDGALTLFRTGTTLKQVSTGLNPTILPVRLQIIARGSSIKVFVNGAAAPSIDVTDSTYLSGFVTLNTCLNAVEFKNTNVMYMGFNWSPVRGNWQEVTGGIRQLDYNTDTSRWITLTGKTFRDVIVQTDITFNNVFDNTKYAGIQVHGDMGKDYRESGILAYIKKDGTAGIMKNGAVIIEKASGANMNSPVNMKLVVRGNDYKVFINNSADSLLEYFNDDYVSGTVSLVTYRSDASFTNISVQGMKGYYAKNLARGASVNTSTSIESAGFYRTQINDGNSLSCWSSNGYTDNANHTETVILDLGTQKTFNRVDLYPRPDSGEGFPVDFIISTSPDNVTWTDRVIRQNYPAPGKYEQSFNLNASVTAQYVKITATKLDYVTGDSYRFQLGEVSVYNNDIISFDNFNESGAWLPYIGTWKTENGNYSQSETTSWYDGSVLQGKKLANFTIEFKMMNQSATGGWAGILFRKSNWNDNHEQSGYLLNVNTAGTVSLYRSGGVTLQSASPGITPTNWNTFKVVVNGINIKVYLNGSNTASLDVTDSTYSYGAISLVTGTMHTHFDDVKITPYF